MPKMCTCKDSYDSLKHIITDVVIKDLATKLRKQCYDNGVEKDPKQSAKTLHQLGLEYKEKSPDKISLIQSVALMTSAVLRQPDNAGDIKKDLDDVCLHIMTLADAANPNVELVSKAAAETKEQTKTFRDKTNDKLGELKPISDDLKADELYATREKRVERVREIQHYVTDTYTKIMSFIADCTANIMGKPPCRFALLGMGSLAKKEVTPYSDFESIIVLEEGIQNQENYSIVLDYFRWFATVFQMILVRLGETLLRFLVIPCLNDPLNNKEDWYYDAYTPCGICPDGFAPQASKNPLGNTTLELIKPVSEMTKCLESNTDLKNGYHLADMLTTTCFVFGDVSVYKQFDSKIEKILNQMPIFNERVQQNIKKDYELYNVGSLDIRLKMDVKRVVLRSCTLFVLALGRLYDCKNLSCFDILDELSDRGIIDQMMHTKLQFSLAVACEIRLRWYSKTSSQSDIITREIVIGQPSSMEKLSKDIGSRAVVDGLVITEALQQYVVTSFTEKTKKKIQFLESPVRAVLLTWRFAMYRLALKLIKECEDSEECKNEHVRGQLQFIYATSLHRCGDYENCLEVCKDELTRFTLPSLVDIRGLYLELCHRCLFYLKRFKEALEFTKLLSVDFNRGMKSVSQVEINADMGRYYLFLKDMKTALKYLELAYNQTKEKQSHNCDENAYNHILYYYSICLNFSGCYDKALSVHDEWISEIRKLHGNEDTDPNINWAFYSKGISLHSLKKYEEALMYLDKSRNVIINTYRRPGTMYLVCPKVECLIKLRRLAEAESFMKDFWHERMEHIRMEFKAELPTKEFSDFHYLIYQAISTQRFDGKQPYDAIWFAKNAFKLGRLKSIEMLLNSLQLHVRILLNLRRGEECLAAAKHGLKLWQFACEHYWLEEKFVVLVYIFSYCELELGIRPTKLNYDCTPSIFYHAGTFWYRHSLNCKEKNMVLE